MLCNNCGTQLPDQASFCWKCGKPQKSEIESGFARSSSQSETCEIDWEDKSGFLNYLTVTPCGRFVAKAIGSRGVYIAGTTKIFTVGFFVAPTPMSSNRSHVAYHSALVEYLVKDGWEPVLVSGVQWWQSSFRRTVK